MNRLSLEIGQNFRPKQKMKYYLFVGLRDKRYTFETKKEADKFLRSFTSTLQTLIDDFSIYHQEAYNLFIESMPFIDFKLISKFNNRFSFLVECLSRINRYHSDGFSSWIYKYIYETIDIIEYFKNLFKNRRFNSLNKKIRYLLRQCNFSMQLIENVIEKYIPKMSEIPKKEIPVVTLGADFQYKILAS